MKNGKNILFFCMFNCMSTFLIMSMERQLVPMNGTVSCLNGTMVKNVSLCGKQNTPYHVKPLERTTVLKKSMSLAQEKNNILLNKIHDKIDKEHLKINTDDLFRPVIGTFWSFRKIAGLDREQMIDELTTIQSYITAEDKESIFQKLEERHYYVNMLLQVAVDTKVKEFDNIKGSTIDTLFFPFKQNSFKRMVHKRALEEYFSNLDTRQWLSLIGRNGFENFHATVLYGNGYFKIHSNTVAMSSDYKYVRAIDFGNNELVWDVEQGVSVELSDRDMADTKWIDSEYTFDKREIFSFDGRHDGFSHMVTLVSGQDISDAIYLYDSGAVYQTKNVGGWISQAIILYKTAQKADWFIQAALENSATKEELLALLHSKTLAAVKGFPKENFKTYIQAKINKL